MPNTITSQTIIDSTTDLVVKVHLASDGTEETGGILVDASTFSPVFLNEQLIKLEFFSSSAALQAYLLWDADTDVPLLAIPPSFAGRFKFEPPLPNNGGAGRTGDILLTTLGLASGDQLTFVFHLRKALTLPIQGKAS